MKKLLIIATLFPMAAMAQPPVNPLPLPTCTHTVAYTIFDANGNVMDKTEYIRNWPLDCFTSTRLKYETLNLLINNGEAQFNALIGESQE